MKRIALALLLTSAAVAWALDKQSITDQEQTFYNDKTWNGNQTVNGDAGVSKNLRVGGNLVVVGSIGGSGGPIECNTALIYDAGYSVFDCRSAAATFNVLAPTTTQGDLIYRNSTTNTRLAKSTTATRYVANTGTDNNPEWAQVDLTNGVTGALPIANGGTGQATATAGFDALAPTTTQGDIIYFDGSDNVRLPKGSATQVLTMNAGATAPEWAASAACTTGCTFGGTTTVSILKAAAHVYTVADNAVGASAATDTLQPTSSYVHATCSDADGCDLTLGESGVSAGMIFWFINISANAFTFPDSSTVSETSGTLTIGQWDAVKFAYTADRWVQITPVQNN